MRVEDLVTSKDEIEPFNTSPDMTMGVEIKTTGEASLLLLHGSNYYTVQEQRKINLREKLKDEESSVKKD